MKSNKLRRILNFNWSKFNRHYTHALFSGSTKSNYYRIIKIRGINFRGLLKSNWSWGHTFEVVSYFILQTEKLLHIPNFLRYGGCLI